MDVSEIFLTFRNKPKKIVIARGKGEKTVGTVVLSELLPFKKVMKLQLQKRGFNVTGMSFRNLVITYYNEFVSNKVDKSSSYIPVNFYEFLSNPVFRMNKIDNYCSLEEKTKINLYVSNIRDVVDNTVDFFKRSLLKKQVAIESGFKPKQVLNPEELVQAAATEKVLKELENKALQNHYVKNSELNEILFIGIVVLILYLIFQ